MTLLFPCGLFYAATVRKFELVSNWSFKRYKKRAIEFVRPNECGKLAMGLGIISSHFLCPSPFNLIKIVTYNIE